MYHDYSPSINRMSSDEDAAIKAISLLMNGFPIKINNKEIVLLDKIYERKISDGSACVVHSSMSISEIPYIIGKISNEEHNYIVESYRFYIENKKEESLVTSIVSSLKDDFHSVVGKKIEISEYHDVNTFDKTSLSSPILVDVNIESSIRFSSNTLDVPGGRIDRIDSIWYLSIDNKKCFVWGPGINLKKELTKPNFNIVSYEKENSESLSSLSY